MVIRKWCYCYARIYADTYEDAVKGFNILIQNRLKRLKEN